MEGNRNDMDRKDDMMDLDDIRAMLGDVPDGGDFDLDSIIAEVEGRAPAQPKAAPEVKPAPQPEPAAAPKAPEAPQMQAAAPAEPPRTAPKTRPARPAPAQEPEEDDDHDPRAERIAAREAKAAARREKAAEKIAAKKARRAEREAEREAEEEAAEAAAPQYNERMTRKEAKRARQAAEAAEEAEEITLRDPAQYAQKCKRRAMGLSARSILVLILAAAAAYLSLAPSFDKLPLPSMLDIIENPAVGIGALLILQFLAIFIGVDVFGKGFSSLFHGMPDRTSLVSFAILAAILHSASIIVFDSVTGVKIPYIAVSILLLYAAMREERGRASASARAYQAICNAQEPMAVYSHYDREDDACYAVKKPLYNNEDFLREMERPDTVDRFSMIYAPIALAAAIIFSLIASVVRGEPVRFFWAFSAILSVSAPLGMLCAYGASYKNVSRRLASMGAAIAGARQANLLRGTEEVIVTENDLFPAGSISLEALQNMGQMSDDKILACAAALTEAAGLEVGHVLTEATRERYGVTLTARNLQTVEGGLKADIGTSHVVVGSASLMVKMGMRLRASEGDPENVDLYVVVDNTLTGVVTMRYQPTKSTYQAMRLMRRMHMNATLAVRDFNISPAMVEYQFDLRRGYVDQPAPESVRRLLDPAYAKGDAPAAMLTREGAGPFLQVLRCADKLAGSVRSALTLGAFAGICGMLIVFYLVFQNAAEALPVMNLLLYLLIWYIPSFIITQH